MYWSHSMWEAESTIHLLHDFPWADSDIEPYALYSPCLDVASETDVEENWETGSGWYSRSFAPIPAAGPFDRWAGPLICQPPNITITSGDRSSKERIRSAPCWKGLAVSVYSQTPLESSGNTGNCGNSWNTEACFFPSTISLPSQCYHIRTILWGEYSFPPNS